MLKSLVKKTLQKRANKEKANILDCVVLSLYLTQMWVTATLLELEVKVMEFFYSFSVIPLIIAGAFGICAVSLFFSGAFNLGFVAMLLSCSAITSLWCYTIYQQEIAKSNKAFLSGIYIKAPLLLKSDAWEEKDGHYSQRLEFPEDYNTESMNVTIHTDNLNQTHQISYINKIIDYGKSKDVNGKNMVGFICMETKPTTDIHVDLMDSNDNSSKTLKTALKFPNWISKVCLKSKSKSNFYATLTQGWILGISAILHSQRIFVYMILAIIYAYMEDLRYNEEEV